ncbi:unnamed protein product [Vitrella brassicaformis CCMP3155]|uniref:Uncharacterized protein n=2 Tax=Vitrella brassicaformis TaxID=1169539 RepID=A0A0G4FXZ7_VITBC|nr:unnamed protein product [Vitrella brassicaformis CCMP3155]|eukprot:CEM20307.1 unnamed protein product [Vitrella brassicaformis CCMP3155]
MQAGRRLPREDLILISGFGVWPLFSNSISMEAGAQCRQLDIDCSRAADRAFWQAMPVNVAKRWGGRMPKLTRTWCCHPAGEGAWCLDVITALIEGHTEARRAMVAEKRREAERRGEEADIADGSLTAITFEAAELSQEEMLSVGRINPILPPVHAPPPSLPALTSISGLTAHHRGIGSRGWRVPSLQRVQAHEHVDTLGPLVSSSRCLRAFDVSSTVDQKAEVLEQVPVAAERHQGPLANLEGIGPIETRGVLFNLQELDGWASELQLILVARGCCRSLRSLKVKLVDEAMVSHPVFLFAEDLQEFANAVCVDNVPLTLTGGVGIFDLVLLQSALFPPASSPILKTVLRQLAQQAAQVSVGLNSTLSTPLDTPTPAMLDLARGLAFDKATRVLVANIDSLLQAPAAPPAPAPGLAAVAIIEEMQPIPQASALVISERMTAAVGIELASKMPNLQQLLVNSIPKGEAVRIADAIGCDSRSGELSLVHLVPAGVTDVVEFACRSLRSLMQLSCEMVVLNLLGLDAATRDLLESAVPDHEQLAYVCGTIIVLQHDDNKLSIAHRRS